MARTYLTGNTYPVKDRLRQLGCRWDADRRAWYADSESVAEQARALIPATPLYNSPPPADLGTADPAALAAQHGRTAVAGAKIESHHVYGLAKADDGQPNGTVHLVRRKRGQPCVRILQVARTPRRYLSREWLEDCDLFDAEPGGSYQWDGVEVKPTDAERAADQAEAERKAAEQRAREEAAAQAKAEQEARSASWEAAIAGLDCSTVGPATCERTGLHLPISDGCDGYQIRLPDGRLGWHKAITGGDDWRDYYYLPADAANEARLAVALERGTTPEEAERWLSQYSGCHGADYYRAIAAADESTKQRLRDRQDSLRHQQLADKEAQERRSVERSVRDALAKIPAVASHEIVYGPEYDAYVLDHCERWQWGTKPRYGEVVSGTVAVRLRLRPDSYTSRGAVKTAVARSLPEELRVHNYLTAKVEIVPCQS